MPQTITFVPDRQSKAFKEGQASKLSHSVYQPEPNPYPAASTSGMNWSAGWASKSVSLRTEAKPNTNCLEGIRCPKCGQSDEFLIEYTSVARVTDDGAVNAADMEWDEQSYIACDKCEHRERLIEFKEVDRRCKHVTMYALYKYDVLTIDPDEHPSWEAACVAASEEDTDPAALHFEECRYAYVNDADGNQLFEMVFD